MSWLSTIVGLLPVVGSVVAKAPEFAAWYHEAVNLLHPSDQATAKEAYQDLIAENAEGHAALQAKLDAIIAAGK
jgi:uncharacterized iron-regulated protein